MAGSRSAGSPDCSRVLPTFDVGPCRLRPVRADGRRRVRAATGTTPTSAASSSTTARCPRRRPRRSWRERSPTPSGPPTGCGCSSAARPRPPPAPGPDRHVRAAGELAAGGGSGRGGLQPRPRVGGGGAWRHERQRPCWATRSARSVFPRWGRASTRATTARRRCCAASAWRRWPAPTRSDRWARSTGLYGPRPTGRRASRQRRWAGRAAGQTHPPAPPRR